MSDIKLIAEFKRYSPWDGDLTSEPTVAGVTRLSMFNPWAISVLVDAAWHGSYSDLALARSCYKGKLLAKGRDVDPVLARRYGADYWLSMEEPDPEYASNCIWEVSQRDDFKKAFRMPELFGVMFNNRDLQTGKVDHKRVGDLASQVGYSALQSNKNDKFIIAASGYTWPLAHNPPPEADAVLVGSFLMRGH